MYKKFRDATRPVLYLAAWWLLITVASEVIPMRAPLKSYRWPGAWHRALLALAPIGAWQAAKYGGHAIAFLLYGVLCTAWYVDRWASSLGFWSMSDPNYVPEDIACTALPIAMGLFCRWIAVLRISMMAKRARLGEYCANCEYNLKGNVSGICPECGEPITGTRPEDSSATNDPS